MKPYAIVPAGLRHYAVLSPGSSAPESDTGPCSCNMPVIQTFIVEDSPIILDNLSATLEELAPVKVVGSAADEKSALRWLSDPSHRCDLAIIDIFLKSGSGLGVLKAMAGDGATLMKRVVLTNYATPDMRQKCKALGADRVFDKSSELDELLTYCAELGDAPEPPAGAAQAQ